MVTRCKDLELSEGDREQWSPAQLAEKQRLLVELASAAPKRGTTGQISEADADLFAHHDQPDLF